MDIIQTDILIIGGGSGGLSVAAGASQMGAKVVLCEANQMGGDCLNTGCVPSKALIAASRANQSVKKAAMLGVSATTPNSDFSAIHQHVHATIERIAPNDSVERFEGLGVKVIKAKATFIDRKTVQAGQYQIKAKYIVIATGSSPYIPPIPGLDKVPFLTNETLFTLSESPQTLAVIGGGPIGCEIACAYALLGVKVILFEASETLLSTVDDEARNLLRSHLIESGIDIHEACQIDSVDYVNNEYAIHTESGCYNAQTLLVATGRKPNIADLALHKTTIHHTRQGISIDKRMRTSQKRIFAIGDVTGTFQFTHAAGYQAGIVIRNILFKLPAKVDYRAFPWVVYTTPEIAQVGLSIKKATAEDATILKYALEDNDRAVAEKETAGFINVAVSAKGNILGVTIVAAHAGELITPWIVAIQNKLTIKQMAGWIAPYPTLSDASKRVAGSYFSPLLFSPKTKRFVRFLLKVFS